MIKGDNYRPLILGGKSLSTGSCIGKLIMNDNIDKRQDMIQCLDSNHISCFIEGYSGYIFESISIPEHILDYLVNQDIPFIIGINSFDTLSNNDVIEINSDRNVVVALHRADSHDNALVVTNNCNCNCVMCPDSFAVRQKEGTNQLERLIKLVSLIEPTTKYLCITGGEPTLLKEDLFTLLNYCSIKLPQTHFTFLTNARMFYYKQYSQQFVLNKPSNLIVGIPLYGHTPNIHDFITNTVGSFKQTIGGIKNLYDQGIKLEIRIVVSKLNYKELYNISNFVINNFPQILRVSIMTLEMLGNAIVNKDRVWIEYEEMKIFVETAATNFIKNGVETYLYNFPLCYVDESLWSITVKSISDYKVRYFDECGTCKIKIKCGGFFSSTINIDKFKAKPFL